MEHIDANVIDTIRKALINRYDRDQQIQQLIEEIGTEEGLGEQELIVVYQAYLELKERMQYTANLVDLWNQIESVQERMNLLHTYDRLEDDLWKHDIDIMDTADLQDVPQEDADVEYIDVNELDEDDIDDVELLDEDDDDFELDNHPAYESVVSTTSKKEQKELDKQKKKIEKLLKKQMKRIEKEWAKISGKSKKDNKKDKKDKSSKKKDKKDKDAKKKDKEAKKYKESKNYKETKDLLKALDKQKKKAKQDKSKQEKSNKQKKK